MQHEIQTNRRVLDRNKNDGRAGREKEMREREEGGVTEVRPGLLLAAEAVRASTIWGLYQEELWKILVSESGKVASPSPTNDDFAAALRRATALQRELEGANDLPSELRGPLHPVFRDSLRRLFRNVDPVRTSAEDWQWEVIGRVLDGHISQMVDKVMDGSSSLTSTSPVIINANAVPHPPVATPTVLPPPPGKAPLRTPTSQVGQTPPTPLASPKSLVIMQEIIDRARELGMAPLSGEQLFALMKGEMAWPEPVPVASPAPSIVLPPKLCQQRPTQVPRTLARNKPTANVTFADSDLDSDTIDDEPRLGAPSTPVFAQTEVFMRIDQCAPQDRIHPHARPPEHQYPASDEYDDAEPEPLHMHRHPPDHQHPAFDDYSDTEPDPIHLHARPPERDHPTPSMNHDCEPDRIHLHARPPEDGYPIPDNFDYSEPDYYHPPDDYQDDRDNTRPRPVYDSEDDYEMGIESNLRDAYEEGYEEGYEDGSAADYAESGVYESNEDASDLSELDEPHGYSGDEDHGNDRSTSGEHSYYESDE
ncbi:hypothetical protein D9611_010560 [Ephemerocybe angulata]|uniref:Uncharacterized protein n=1 Tax=Ephemerocybe angulata TaxID=980116 RepID=A0A8H5FAW4_9AGAR|nr:hypothetical protein D9611_010560 [Tulosesus angulatus]